MRTEKVLSVDAAADSADWQNYSSLSQRLARNDSDANATIAALINAIDRKAAVELRAGFRVPSLWISTIRRAAALKSKRLVPG